MVPSKTVANRIKLGYTAVTVEDGFMIPLIKSTFYNEVQTIHDLRKFLTPSRRLSFGDYCEKFEKKFATWQGRKECIMVNSGSSANLALLQALLNLGKLKKGDKVGFSAITWSTNVMPLIQLGLIPIPIDVEIPTLNMSPKTLLTAIKKTPIKMLFLTNLLGFCDDIAGIAHICREKGILLIEDTCESLGSTYKGKKLGNYGLASTFSFYVGHHMSTIEGGAICTDNEELATMLRLVRAHGWDRNLSLARQKEIRNVHKVNSNFYSRYTFYDLGYNLRPTEINGFLGCHQLKYLNTIIAKRQKNFLLFSKVIYTNGDTYLPIRYSHMDTISNFAVPVICKDVSIRNALVKKCDAVLEIRPIVGGSIVRQPFFSKYMQFDIACPNALLIHNQGLYFGNNPNITGGDIEVIKRIFA